MFLLNTILIWILIGLCIFTSSYTISRKNFIASYSWLFVATILLIFLLLIILFSHDIPFNIRLNYYLVIYFFSMFFCYGTLYFTRYLEFYINPFFRKICTCALIVIIFFITTYICYVTSTNTVTSLSTECTLGHVNYYHIFDKGKNDYFGFFIIIPIFTIILLIVSLIKYGKKLNIALLISVICFILSFLIFFILTFINNPYMFSLLIILLIVGESCLLKNLIVDKGEVCSL